MAASTSATSANGVYSERGGGGSSINSSSSAVEAEFASAASGRFFSSDARKHEDLKDMLDSNKDGLKLEAMKRIIGMIAKGRDASGLFPSVVKNVVCQNIEVKKLVYVYLVRYAEEQQDLALLSISTFQRALKDPNQLIRASALRVLSSIRVAVIVPIMFLAIRDAVSDMSPYVRKTAAHAIPKLYSLDPDQKDALVEVIERLLGDKTTLVVGSAVMAFEEVCPERIDLVHRNYRELCNLLVDVEEWGQVVIILMLTRYARTQFTDPNLATEVCSVSGEDSQLGRTVPTNVDEGRGIDPDLRLLLRNCQPLLQSRNSAVVMAVCQLYYHLAPSAELAITTKALIRLLRGHRETQTVVLSNIASLSSMSTSRKGMFEPHLKSFFVRTSDPTQIKLLKLEVLANLATETNISVILREFQTYLQSTDMEFVQATIHCIGRVAHQIKEVADTCLGGLTALLSSRNELVVAESVVVIKKLLQIEPGQHAQIIRQMARLLDNIQVPMARASILWLIAEYAEPKIAPDVLRRIAKTFCQEEDIVKLQALNLASRLALTNNQPQTKLIVQYIFNLAKYDQNYDTRDRVRFLRHLCVNPEPTGLGRYAKKLLLSSKPAPKLQSAFGDRDQYQMGSLSHLINQPAAGYQELPDFPDEAPDPSVRNVTPPPTTISMRETRKSKDFYDESEEGSRSGSGSQSSSSNDSDSSTDSDDTNKENRSDDIGKSAVSESSSDTSSKGTEDSESDSSSDDSNIVRKAQQFTVSKGNNANGVTATNGKSERGTTANATKLGRLVSSGGTPPFSSNAQQSNNSAEWKGDDEDVKATNKPTNRRKSKKSPTKKPAHSVDLLLDFDMDDIQASIPAPTLPAQLLVASTTQASKPKREPARLVTPVSTAIWTNLKRETLVRAKDWNGLEILYRYTRCENIFSSKMTSIELSFENRSDRVFQKVAVKAAESVTLEVKGVQSQVPLSPGASFVATIGVDFKDSAQVVRLELTADEAKREVRLTPAVCEILRPVIMARADFDHFKHTLGGMCQFDAEIVCSLEFTDIREKLQQLANVLVVAEMEAMSAGSETGGALRFAAQTLNACSLVLVEVRQAIGSNDVKRVQLVVNCELLTVGRMLLAQIKEALASDR
ncbi:AP-3 complex subunit beta-2-like [Tropilaelaps mercedesae]|uniref:AP-3 complex subunit beta n=1 Tax=Tropilaelaps mercedesae TaxID=418985 RepID=A0A1V9XSN7_9ACAR|nr:AP-3 complex subunit beta-2-like [Tropilaelaps mercedesae]